MFYHKEEYWYTFLRSDEFVPRWYNSLQFILRCIILALTLIGPYHACTRPGHVSTTPPSHLDHTTSYAHKNAFSPLTSTSLRPKSDTWLTATWERALSLCIHLITSFVLENFTLCIHIEFLAGVTCILYYVYCCRIRIRPIVAVCGINDFTIRDFTIFRA